MEFLKLYDVTKQLNALKDNNRIHLEDNHIVKYYIQMDTHDYHVFRIINGSYDESNEGREHEVLTVEMQNVDKFDLLEDMGYEFKNRQKRDQKLDSIDDEGLFECIIKFDMNEGMSNWTYDVVENLLEGVNLVTQNGNYQVA